MIRAALPLVLLLATQCHCQQWLFSNIGNFNPLGGIFGGGRNSESFVSGGGNFAGNSFTDADFPMETSGSEPQEVFLRTVFMPFFGQPGRGGGGGGGGGGGVARPPPGAILIRGPPPGLQGGQDRPNVQPETLGSAPFPTFSNFNLEGPFANEPQGNGPNQEGAFHGPFLGADSIQGPPPNFNPEHPNNFNQGPPSPPNFNQGPTPNFNQGPPPNFNQGPPPNFNQGPQPNFNQGPQHNFNDGPTINLPQGLPFRIEGPFREGRFPDNIPHNLPQFPPFQHQQHNNNNQGSQGASSQPQPIPIPVNGNVIPVKVQLPQASGQPIIQNALLLLVPPNIPLQGGGTFQGNLAAAAAAAGRAAMQMQHHQNQGQQKPNIEHGFRPIQNHPNHQMESSIQYHQAHDIPQNGGYVPFTPAMPHQKVLKPLQAKKFLASSVKTTTSQKGHNQEASATNHKKYVAITASDVKPRHGGEVLKKVVRVPASSHQHHNGRSMPPSGSPASATLSDVKPAESVKIETTVAAGNNTQTG